MEEGGTVLQGWTTFDQLHRSCWVLCKHRANGRGDLTVQDETAAMGHAETRPKDPEPGLKGAVTTKQHFGTIVWAMGTGRQGRAAAAQQGVWPSGTWPSITGAGFGAV